MSASATAAPALVLLSPTDGTNGSGPRTSKVDRSLRNRNRFEDRENQKGFESRSDSSTLVEPVDNEDREVAGDEVAAVVGEVELMDRAGEAQPFFHDSAGEVEDLHSGIDLDTEVTDRN